MTARGSRWIPARLYLTQGPGPLQTPGEPRRLIPAPGSFLAPPSGLCMAGLDPALGHLPLTLAGPSAPAPFGEPLCAEVVRCGDLSDPLWRVQTWPTGKDASPARPQGFPGSRAPSPRSGHSRGLPGRESAGKGSGSQGAGSGAGPRHHRLSAWGQLHLERALSAPGVKHIWAGRLHLRPEPMSAFPSTLWSVWQNQGVPWPHVLAPQAQPDSSIHAWEVPGTRCPARG